MARYRCSLNRSPRAQKKLPASAGYRGSDLVLWHFQDLPDQLLFVRFELLRSHSLGQSHDERRARSAPSLAEKGKDFGAMGRRRPPKLLSSVIGQLPRTSRPHTSASELFNVCRLD